VVTLLYGLFMASMYVSANLACAFLSSIAMYLN
jgi:hypothetical protein